MKIIYDSNGVINFHAKNDNKLLKKAAAVTVAAASVVGTTVTITPTLKAETNIEKINREANIKLMKRECLIESKIKESINSKSKITIKRLAKELNMPVHLVITSIYRAKSNLRHLFDIVKDTSYMRKPASDFGCEMAADIVNNSKSFMTNNNKINIENAYIKNLGRKFDQLDCAEECKNDLRDFFQTKPALADLILFSRSKKDAGLYSQSTIKSIMSAHDINPELTEKLTTEKKEDGHFYSLREIYKIVRINQLSPKLLDYAKKDANFVYALMIEKMSKEKTRYGVDDILQIMHSIQTDTDFATAVMNQKIGVKGSRFNGKQVRLILNLHEKYPYIVSDLITEKQLMSYGSNEYKYSACEVEKILEILDGGSDDKIRDIIFKLRENKIK